MTKPVTTRIRRLRRKLKDAPGTLWRLARGEFATDHNYKPSTVRNIRETLCDFAEAIGHDPKPRDFTAANIEKVRGLVAMRVTSINATSKIAILKRLWQWCDDKAIAAQPPAEYRTLRKPGNPLGKKATIPVLTDAEGTLWHYCLTLYFPKNIKINCHCTRKLYAYAIGRLKQVVGHDPTLADLTDDNVAAVMRMLKDGGNAAETINGYAGKLRALWSFLAKKRLMPDFPVVQNVKEPKRIPQAWTRDELDRLIAACRRQTGTVRGVSGVVLISDFFVALFHLIWDTSERIGAARAIRKEWVNWQTGDLLIPAECRKGQERDMSYRLHPDTLVFLQRIAGHERDLLFGGVNTDWLYYHLALIRRTAGLPVNRKTAFHCIRRSVASHLHAGGHNATDALGHASADVTRRSYLDPKISGAVRPADVLFRPGKADGNAAVIALDLSPREAVKLPRARLLKGGVA